VVWLAPTSFPITRPTLDIVQLGQYPPARGPDEQNLSGVIALCARLRIPLTHWQIDVLRKMKPRKGAVRS
jgi:hypothetical protein